MWLFFRVKDEVDSTFAFSLLSASGHPLHHRFSRGRRSWTLSVIAFARRLDLRHPALLDALLYNRGTHT